MPQKEWCCQFKDGILIFGKDLGPDIKGFEEVDVYKLSDIRRLKIKANPESSAHQKYKVTFCEVISSQIKPSRTYENVIFQDPEFNLMNVFRLQFFTS